MKVHAIEIDLSRRQNELKELTNFSSTPAQPTALAVVPVVSSNESVPLPKVEPSNVAPPQTNEVVAVTKPVDSEVAEALKKVVVPTDSTKEVVIIQTEDGFIPSTVQLKKDEVYKIHVVNLNMKEKNVSFLLDAFTQSYNTVYGVQKSFSIEPKVEGVFSFQCPETGMQGKLVVTPAPDFNGKDRKMASEQ